MVSFDIRPYIRRAFLLRIPVRINNKFNRSAGVTTLIDDRPIGLFDSGLGGLTVFRELEKLLPAESVIYFGDTANVPYGSRRPDELLELADKIVSYLTRQGVKYIIFACNTSSALSLPVLKKRYPTPMLGVIEPGAIEAARLTRNKRIGLMATEATVNSGAYLRVMENIDGAIKLLSGATPLLVPLVESGESNSPVRADVVRESLAPWYGSGIDTMLLGCTHYPFLAETITAQLDPGVRLADPAGAAVRAAMEEMSELGLLSAGGRAPRRRFVVSGDPEDFRRKAKLLTGNDPGLVEIAE